VLEKNRLLRCFQFLSLKSISYGDFVGTASVRTARFGFMPTGRLKGDRPALACRLEVVDKMLITRLSDFIELEGIIKSG